jgi:uncharacterized protein YacL
VQTEPPLVKLKHVEQAYKKRFASKASLVEKVPGVLITIGVAILTGSWGLFLVQRIPILVPILIVVLAIMLIVVGYLLPNYTSRE